MNKVEYENYTNTSDCYDNTRIPVGVDIYRECFSSNPLPLSDQKILDFGCGTGSCLYSIKEDVAQLFGIELNEGMLAQAREKFRDDDNIHLRQGSLLDALPYPDNTFDGIMCNQVLHHLVAASGTQNFDSVLNVIREAYRILRPHGALIFNTSSRPQVYDGFWWAALIPDAVNKVAERFPPIDLIISMLKDEGFKSTGTNVPVHAVLQGGNYLDPMGPLKKEFRDGDSTWSLATELELQQAQDRVTLMNREGDMAEFLEKREKLREEIGQTTFVYAYK